MTGTRRRAWTRRTLWTLWACIAATLLAYRPTLAQTGAREAAATSCENLASLALPNTRITIAQSIAAGGFVEPAQLSAPPVRPDYSRMRAFCRVAATLTPVPGSEIKIEVWLPTEGWNGKFVGVGNGGFSGAIWYFLMVEPLQLGYAVAGTNTGHDGDGADASFGIGQPEKLTDFAWRAVHEMTVKAKAITSAHYGRSARYAYWLGCSSGGRQGLKEAQRFPGDYDGISAGAPAHNWAPLMAYAVKIEQAVSDPAIGFTPTQLELLKAAAIAACDTLDGVTDRVVEDPRRCAFDPTTLQCTSGNSTNCLTSRQVQAARSLYAGVVNSRTGATLMPGPTPGGEPAWAGYQPNGFTIGSSYFRDLVMRDPNWNMATFDVDRDVERARTEDTADITTTKTDLTEFFARGGKLLLWHGWTDAMIPAQSTIDYYQSALAASGSNAKDAMRLFMLPGVDHCAGGEGTYVVDMLRVIDAWVESGQAPERIVARRPLQGGGAPRTRPLCAFPMVARYRGQGSTDDERNFECGSAPR